MKQKSTFLKVFMTLLLLCGVSSMWGENLELTFDLTKNNLNLPTAKGKSEAGTYKYTLNNVEYSFIITDAQGTTDGGIYFGSSYVMVYSGNAIGTPAIEGYKLTKVVAKNSSTCSTSVNVGISSSASSASYIAGGAVQKWATTSSSYTYELTETDANKVYYLYVTSKNAQITELTLTYSPVASNTPSISASNVDLAADATSGEIDYTISNSVEGKSLTAETSTGWISNVTVDAANRKVTFMITTPNAGAQREGTITLKYEGATDKNVTITQAKPTTFASIEALVAAGEPASDGKETVTVTLTNEPITNFYISSTDQTTRNGIYLMAGGKEIEIYCNDVPSDWIAGGTVSGTLENCKWVNYKGTWELCPEDWDELTYTAPTTYAINIDGAIANGTVEASATEAAAGVEVSLTVTPADHYELVSLNVIDASSNPITVTNNKFTMPASDVTVSATFKELPQYTVTVSDGDESWTKYAGETIELISRTSTNPDYTFVGWSETNVDDETTDVPTLVANPYTVGKNVCLYPVYKRTVVGEPENQTASVTIKDYAAEKKWANGEKYLEVSLDDNISINAISKGTTGQFNSGDNTWRMYQSSANLSIWTVDAANGAELKSVKFDYTNSNDGVLSYNGDTYDSGVEIKLSGSHSDNYTVGNTGSATNGQVRISAIEVKYVISATTNYFVSAIPNQTEMITISSVGYSTYSSTYALVVPETSVAEVYGAKVNDAGTAVTLIPVEEGTIIKAGEGFIVKGTANTTVEFTVSSEAGEAISGNALIGTGATSKTLTANEAYLLGAKDGKAVFALCNAGTLGANKAYLPALAGANGTLGFDDATGIEFEVQDAKSNVVRYNLNGQVVGNDYKGIVIVNGKKFLNK